MFGYLEAKCSSKMVHADKGKQAANNICPGFSCNLAEEVSQCSLHDDLKILQLESHQLIPVHGDELLGKMAHDGVMHLVLLNRLWLGSINARPVCGANSRPGAVQVTLGAAF